MDIRDGKTEREEIEETDPTVETGSVESPVGAELVTLRAHDEVTIFTAYFIARWVCGHCGQAIDEDYETNNGGWHQHKGIEP